MFFTTVRRLWDVTNARIITVAIVTLSESLQYKKNKKKKDEKGIRHKRYYGKLSVTFVLVKKKISNTCKLRAQIKGFRFMYSCYKVKFLVNQGVLATHKRSANLQNPAFCF